jgi:hypothetical protein
MFGHLHIPRVRICPSSVKRRLINGDGFGHGKKWRYEKLSVYFGGTDKINK